jgi:type I restriction enzyme R subunit
VAETIENNVRRLIINESPVDPAYYDKMSKLLDALIDQRRKGMVSYVEYLAKIAALTRHSAVPGADQLGSYPPDIDTPALRALFNNLQNYPSDLAVAIDTAIKASLQSGWRENSMKVKKVRVAVRYVLATVIPAHSGLGVSEPGVALSAFAALAAPLDLEKETDRILELAKQQHYDY